MTDEKRETGVELDNHECGVRVWSSSCQRNVYTNESDKYLCATCTPVEGLTHEMHHEHFPHLSGDSDEMS